MNSMNFASLYIMAFVLAFLISFAMTPVAKKIAFKVGAIANPRKRDMHSKPIPRMGGIAIVTGFMITLFISIQFITVLDWKQVIGITSGALIIFLLGFFDDIYELSAKLKFLIQILAATIVSLSGVSIPFISIPFIGGSPMFLDMLSIPITVIWIVGITNAVNFIDGLDGLAAGVSSIASICLMVLSIYSGYPIAILLTTILAGSCLGFLPYNFNPASIFMGDTGSTFLGFILAVTSILGLLKSYTIVTIVIAVLVLGLPVFDTAFAIIRRLLAGKPITSPDRGHLHHRLVDRGYSQKQAVITLYAISGVFGLSAIAVANHDFRFIVAIFVIMGLLLYFNLKIMSSHNDDKKD
ncbi:MAG: undecaprenyl/decaprenyl-phosphate alpha-N-acetylglucosaminyl 1-phosphate transferase [Candidatus Niameybacter stercoravium]|nr:undecaprenyl/decaprenyl-phosphate alpha-N-acetylglucosaminyl 1-phosphate transferase [Candidatus Niameybacter stercoravium]